MRRGAVVGRDVARAIAASRALVAAAALGVIVMPVPASAQTPPPAAPTPYEIVGDAIARPLTDTPGDAARGRAIVVNRQVGMCLLCHTGPFPEERFQGTVAPSLAGAGSRWTEGQLRLRIVDNRHLNAATLMPSFYRVDGLARVGAAWGGRTVLTAQQVEDVVALLRTLRD